MAGTVFSSLLPSSSSWPPFPRHGMGKDHWGFQGLGMYQTQKGQKAVQHDQPSCAGVMDKNLPVGTGTGGVSRRGTIKEGGCPDHTGLRLKGYIFSSTLNGPPGSP
jgi:hypothetical protein